ncbi:MAG: aminotransferase class V-fold PLP-dependent enzyme [Bacteroidetes bacterium]|jgi:phosphoserine aminotransferase|nr:aminotransferase class V-fold PLP-dependent enzyme [Bacteroidota bacterium]
MKYTFAPGPSQLQLETEWYLQEAVASGLLSESHRSPAFSQLYEEVLQGFRSKLELPDSYSLYFLSSATECWEVLTAGLISENALHVYSGAFGQRWYEYARAIRPGVEALSFDPDADFDSLKPRLLRPVELVCFTQNETANGTQIRPEWLAEVRAVLQDQLIAVDVTSSLAGQALPWREADAWFASVQKCLGMPAGLGVLVCSPQAQQRIERLGHRAAYNGLQRLHSHWKDRQTSYTPNVLAIYLLSRILQDIPPIRQTDAHLQERAHTYYSLLEQHSWLSPFVARAENRSQTVIAVACPPERLLAGVLQPAQAAGLTLGRGYKPLDKTTFRIANFPALPADAVMELCGLLQGL